MTIVALFPAEAEYEPVEHIQLFVWHDGPRSELRPIHNLLGLHNQIHPQSPIVLNVRPTGEAYQHLMDWSGLERRTTPDMVIVPSGWLDEFGHLLRSLQSALNADQRAAFYSPMLNMFTVKGRLLAIPWLVGARGLLLRTDLLKDAGLTAPQTWDEVLTVAGKLHNPPNTYGIGLPGSTNLGKLMAEITWAYGGKFYDDEGDLTLATEASRAALDLLDELAEFAQPEVLTWTQRELEDLFVKGKVAMLTTDSWWTQELVSDSEVVDTDIQMVGLPGQEEPVAHLVGEGLAILANTAHERECVEFARMICQEQCQRQLLKLQGLPTGPQLAEACRDDVVRAPLTANLGQARTIPARDRQKVFAALHRAAYLVLSGRLDSLEALQQTEAALSVAP